MSIGVGIFLMVLGAILAFAVKTDVPGINVNTLGVILLLIGLVAFVYSLIFWSAVTPWGRRRVNARRRMVGLEPPVELDEEPPPPFDDPPPPL
jgi:hypothetical protein